MGKPKKFIFDEQDTGLEDILKENDDLEEIQIPEVEEYRDDALNDPILLKPKKENRSIRKMILIKPSLDSWVKSLAEKYELSQNEVINQLLEKCRSQMK